MKKTTKFNFEPDELVMTKDSAVRLITARMISTKFTGLEPAVQYILDDNKIYDEKDLVKLDQD